MNSRLLMHVGPSISNPDVLAAAGIPNYGFASPEFNEAMKYSLEGLRLVMGGGNSFMPFILPCSGTGAMESTISLLNKGAKVLVVSNGVFGDRWEKILSRYPVEFKVLRSPPGLTVPVDQVVTELTSNHYDAVTLTHVETSTGARIPLKDMAHAIRPYVDLIIVDGVASVGGERVNVSDWNIDVCLTAGQKAIGAQAGTGLLVVSERALEKLGNPSISGYLLDLRNWLPIMQAFLSGKGGYFATPPVGAVFSLRKSFELIRNETMEKRIERHRMCSEAFRKGIREMGLEVVAAEGFRSNTVTGVYIENVRIPAFLEEAMKNGVEFAAGVHEQIRDRYFRVGHMGWVEPEHILKALSVIETSASSMSANIRVGTAEPAAMEILQKMIQQN